MPSNNRHDNAGHYDVLCCDIRIDVDVADDEMFMSPIAGAYGNDNVI